MDNYENSLFKTANKLRGKIPPSDYKFYVLPLVYIRYLSEKNANGVWNRIVSECGSSDIATLLDDELTKVLPVFDGIKNPYEKMYDGLNRKFRKELGWFGELAKSPEELAEEEEKGSFKIYSPWDFPDKYPKAEEIKNKYFEFEERIAEYKEKCKDEFFTLFSKYFWMLWD